MNVEVGDIIKYINIRSNGYNDYCCVDELEEDKHGKVRAWGMWGDISKDGKSVTIKDNSGRVFLTLSGDNHKIIHKAKKPSAALRLFMLEE